MDHVDQVDQVDQVDEVDLVDMGPGGPVEQVDQMNQVECVCVCVFVRVFVCVCVRMCVCVCFTSVLIGYCVIVFGPSHRLLLASGLTHLPGPLLPPLADAGSGSAPGTCDGMFVSLQV